MVLVNLILHSCFPSKIKGAFLSPIVDLPRPIPVRVSPDLHVDAVEHRKNPKRSKLALARCPRFGDKSNEHVCHLWPPMANLLGMMVIVDELLFGTAGQCGSLRRPPSVDTLRLVVTHEADGVVELLQGDTLWRSRR